MNCSNSNRVKMGKPVHLAPIFSTYSARKVAILLAIGDREFTFGELSMKAGCHLTNKNYDF
jgi:hypothetical protein